ncbi:helix-turn-helix domain-containing protein [Patescibacteria group bacterium]
MALKPNYHRLPVTKKYFEKFLKKVDTPLRAGQSVTSVGLPLDGRSGFIQFFLREARHLSKPIKQFHQDFEFFYFDLKNLDSPEQIFTKVEECPKSKGKKWSEHLRKLTYQKNRQLVFIIDHAEKLLVLPPRWRQTLWQVFSTNPMAIRTWFLANQEIHPVKAKRKLGSLSLPFFQNLVFHPLLDPGEILIGLNNQVSWHDLKITPLEKKQIIKLSGGWGSLMRIFVRKLTGPNQKLIRAWLSHPKKTETKKAVLADKEIDQHFNQLYQAFLPETQLFLEKVYQQKLSFPKIKAELPNYPSKTGVFTLNPKSKFGLDCFCPWFRDFLIKEISRTAPRIKKTGPDLYFNDLDLANVLTAQEYLVFKKLYAKKNRLVSREEIAKTMWPENWTEKYSEWAIDKVIARIRKKIGDSGRKQVLQVIKGHGLKLKVA